MIVIEFIAQKVKRRGTTVTYFLCSFKYRKCVDVSESNAFYGITSLIYGSGGATSAYFHVSICDACAENFPLLVAIVIRNNKVVYMDVFRTDELNKKRIEFDEPSRFFRISKI